MKKLILIATLAFTSGAMAAGYGAAGCGLGSMVLGDQKGFMQVFAATTNATSGSQTFGISSGTSNCASGGKTPTQFIEANKTALTLEAAQGEGESLAALSEIYGCQAQDQFNQTIKSNYSEIFENVDSESIDSKIKTIINEAQLRCDLV